MYSESAAKGLSSVEQSYGSIENIDNDDCHNAGYSKFEGR